MTSGVMVLANGHWLEILTHFNLPTEALMNKHGPCPICAGKDRFRWDNEAGRGTFYCNNCGAGDGMALLMKFRGWDFATSSNAIRHILGKEMSLQKWPAEKAFDTGKLIKNLYQTSYYIQQGDPVDRYLDERRINEKMYPKDLRTSLRCYFEPGVYHPAMLAVVRDLDGNPKTFHRTFIHEDGKPPFGTSRRFMPGPLPVGAHVRLGAVQAELGIAEGIETAMACMQRFELPVWSALSASQLGNWQPPPELKLLHIFGDNDQSGTGQAAADKLAWRMQALGIETNIRVPDQTDTDWADVVFRENEGRDSY